MSPARTPLRAVGPKPDERWRVLVEAMTAEVQAADKGQVCSALARYGPTVPCHASETQLRADLDISPRVPISADVIPARQ